MEVTREEILAAALQMADNPVMSEKEVDFRRGAICATRNFIGVVDALISRTETELLLASAELQTRTPFNATAL